MSPTSLQQFGRSAALTARFRLIEAPSERAPRRSLSLSHQKGAGPTNPGLSYKTRGPTHLRPCFMRPPHLAVFPCAIPTPFLFRGFLQGTLRWEFPLTTMLSARARVCVCVCVFVLGSMTCLREKVRWSGSYYCVVCIRPWAPQLLFL